MAKPLNLRVGEFHLSTGQGGDASEMPPETPFRILVCGNLGGTRANTIPLSQRKPIEIDRDNFDEVLAKIAPSVTFANQIGGESITIRFKELEDFEPDRLYEKLPVFETLRALKSQLEKPGTFEAAARKIREWGKITEPDSTPSPAREVSTEEMLRQVMEEGGVPSSGRLPGSDDWQRFLTKIVQPQLVDAPNPRQADYEAVVEEAIGAQMRSILHQPAFQSLEAAWRSVFFLTRRLPTDESLKIFVWEVSPSEWQADFSQADPSESAFFRVVTKAPADRPWAVVVNLEIFGRSVADLEILASMSVLAAKVRTAVFAGVSTKIVGCDSLVTHPDVRTWKPDANLATGWAMVRGLDASRYLGVCTPRFLLRQPYGKKGTRTDTIEFEELLQPDHESYLWGSGAVACALLLAEGFAGAGWGFNPDQRRDVQGLPVHVFDAVEAAMKPCAEVYMPEDAALALIDAGCMVFASQRDRDAIRLLRFQSAHQGGERLAGRWA